MTKSINRSNACFSSAREKDPISPVGSIAFGIGKGVTEQVFEAAFASEGITFQIEKDISSRRARAGSLNPNPGVTGKSS